MWNRRDKWQGGTGRVEDQGEKKFTSAVDGIDWTLFGSQTAGMHLCRHYTKSILIENTQISGVTRVAVTEPPITPVRYTDIVLFECLFTWVYTKIHVCLWWMCVCMFVERVFVFFVCCRLVCECFGWFVKIPIESTRMCVMRYTARGARTRYIHQRPEYPKRKSVFPFLPCKQTPSKNRYDAIGNFHLPELSLITSSNVCVFCPIKPLSGVEREQIFASIENALHAHRIKLENPSIYQAPANKHRINSKSHWTATRAASRLSFLVHTIIRSQ